MLADQLDYVIGVDPHRDMHAVAVVEIRSGLVVFEAVVSADGDGYWEALELAERQRAWASGVCDRGHRLVRRGPDPVSHW